jgi:hypothetical protein
MYFYVFVVLYTQTFYRSLVNTVCSFFVCCILNTLTCTNAIISHINNQTFYRFRVYTVCSMFCYVFVVFYTQSLVPYLISITKHSTVSLFIRYVLVCVCCIVHKITSTNVTISHINIHTF